MRAARPGAKPVQARGPKTIASPLTAREAPRERKRCLDLRGRVVLSGDGARFFLPRVPTLHRFDSGDGEPRFGFRLRSVDVPWLKKLLLAGFVDKAEFPVRETAAVKNEITDLSRLVVFSMLYGRFGSAALERAVETDVIHKWNRQHPQRALDARNVSAGPELRSALMARRDLIEVLKAEIGDPVIRELAGDPRKSPEDASRLSLFARELLDFLDPTVYFALLGSSSDARRALSRDIGRELRSCLDKSDLADYLVLMVLELMGAAERTTLVELIGPGVPPDQIRQRLERPDERAALLARLPNGLSASMVWSLGRRWSLGRWRYRLRLGLYDGSTSYEDTVRLFEERGRIAQVDRSLQDFYEQGDGPYGDDGLGWYYLSFLGEACKSMGVNFEASVRQRKGGKTASVNLVFVF